MEGKGDLGAVEVQYINGHNTNKKAKHSVVITMKLKN